MSPELAKNIGLKKGLKSATIGLVIAFLFITFISGGNILWLFTWNYLMNVVTGVAILYLLAYLFGKKSGYEILIMKKKATLVGVKYGVLSMLTTAFVASWIGFIQEGMELHDTFWDSFEDYIFKPFFWISLIGILPAIIVGAQFGEWIKKQPTTPQNNISYPKK